MLSNTGDYWPASEDWVQQVKWDGFRLLVEVTRSGVVRAWSRHGTSLTDRVPDIVEAFGDAAPGTVVDGELVATAEVHGHPVQDFAAVRRAVFNADRTAAARLTFVAFDLLSIEQEDVRGQPWADRDERLRATLPCGDTVRVIESQPVSRAAHDAIVSLGFEGTVLKRRRSTYRAGRHSAWQKHKARHLARGPILALRRDREGRPWAICAVDEGRVTASASGLGGDAVGRDAEIVYSRVDADGTLREARVKALT